MSDLSDTQLDRLLALAKTPDMPPGFTDRLVQGAWALPQKQPLPVRLRAWFLTDMASWRMAGAAAALLLAFSAGYYLAPPPEEDDLTGMYAIDQSDYVEIL